MLAVLMFSGGIVFAVVAVWRLIVAIAWRDPEPWDEPHDMGRP